MEGSRRPATARTLGDGDVGLWVAFDDRDAAKALPSARWDKHLRCWRINDIFIDDVDDLVYRLNRRQVARARGQGDVVVLTRAMTELFAALPTELRRPVSRALARVLHPDHGGDSDCMKALNAAMEQIA